MRDGSRFGNSTKRLGLLSGLLAVSLILGCFLFCLAGTARAVTRLQAQEVPGDDEQALFVKGQSLYSQNLYHEAIAIFGDFLKTYPQSQIKDLALLWLGRCHIRVGDVGAAEQIALRLRELPETQFVGLYEEELRVARQSYARAATPKAKVESRAVDVPKAADEKLSKSVTPTEKTVGSQSGAYEPIRPNESELSKQTLNRGTTPTVQPTKANVNGSASQAVNSRLEAGVHIRQEQSPRESVGGVTFYRLVIVNEGKAVARDLIVTELLSDDMQFASSDPAPSRQEPVGRSQRLTFRIPELKPGTSRILRIAVRLRVGAAPEAVLKTKHSVSYQDSGKTLTN